MEDFLGSCIRLQKKWYDLKKDQYFIKHYLRKDPKELDLHFNEIENYEMTVAKSPCLWEDDRENLLICIKNYKDDLGIYRTNGNQQGSVLDNHSHDILYFGISLAIGSLLTLLFNIYQEKSKAAQEKGFRDGFAERLNELIGKYGGDNGKTN